MNNKIKEKKVHESFNKISKEMAEFVVNNKKVQIESEIEKEILKVEKKKRRKEKELKKIKLNDMNDNKKFKLKRSNSKEDMRKFRPKNSRLNNDEILNINEPKKDNKTKFSFNNSFKNNSTQNLQNIKKEDIEVTISPFYEHNYEEDNEINYYNIKYYIDNKRRLEKKQLNSQYIPRKIKNNSLFSNNNNIKKDAAILRKKNIKKLTKREYNFLFEDQQKNDSDSWGNYLDDLTVRNNGDKVFLYTNSKNNTFNQSNRDSSSYSNLDENTSNEKIIVKDSNVIFDYFQDRKKDKKNFFEKQINRKRLTEIKINRKRERIKYLESKNNCSPPKINRFSLEIIKNKGEYIPLFKRAAELQNEKNMKILIRQKMKSKSFSMNNSKMKRRTKEQINEFFNKQMHWKNKIEKEKNNLKLKLKKSETQKNTESNFTSRFSKSGLNITRRKRKQKSFFSLYDNKICKSITYSMYLENRNRTNVCFRLYKDYEIRRKNLNKLKKKLTPTFTPTINKSNLNYYITRNHTNSMKKNNSSLQKGTSLIYEYNSSFKTKQQKSRNPKKIYKKKYNNSNVLSQPFNIKEINNNLKSTAVDSRNSKSRTSIEIFGTKLEKINEYKDQDEDYSSSDYSFNNISYKNINTKINKSNKNNKSLELSQKLYTKSESKKSISINNDLSEEKDKNKSEIITKSLLKNNSQNNDELKNNNENKDNSKSGISKEYNSGRMNLNLKLDDIKPLLDNEQNNSNKERQTPTIGNGFSKNNNNENNIFNEKLKIKKKSVEIKKPKDFQELKSDNKSNNIIIGDKKENAIDKNIENINENNTSFKNNINNNIYKNFSIDNIKNQKIDNNNKEMIFDLNNNFKNKIYSTKRINPFKKLFSKEKVEIFQNNKDINLNKIKPKLILLENKSNSSLSNKNDEIGNQLQEENTFKNQYDSVETNNNQFNFDHKESNYLNEFLSNKASSNISYKGENIIQNSSYNFQNEINGLDDNKDSKEIIKKPAKEILKQYKLDDSENEESESEEEENEETRNKSDINNNDYINKDKSFSWIKKLNEISRNEGMESERDYNNKRKNGGSTTRSQTKRKYENNNFKSNKSMENLEQNKLYMLNLRNNSSCGNLNPFTVSTKEPIFYKFFLKKPKHIK